MINQMTSQSKTPIDVPQDLNESQGKAMAYSGGHLLIVAGPGTGKTHTLTHRIAGVADKLWDEKKVLALTFTNKAAAEMSHRLTSRFNFPQEKIFVGTFHKFCLNTLKKFIDVTELPNDFDIATDEQIASIARTLWPEETLRARKAHLHEISKWKSDVLSFDKPQMVAAYDHYLRAKSLVDYDDILRETLILFKHNWSVCQQIQQSYPFVFVDEYQDINSVQHQFLENIISDESELTAIGDPNQAIYGFRGSNVGFFKSFQNDFKRAHVLNLSENYRSSRNLLDASSQIIQKSKNIQVPQPVAKISSLGRLTVRAAASAKAEAEYVVHSIEKLVGGTSMFSQDSRRVDANDEPEVSFGDIAVLYRLNSQADTLQEAFNRSGIPFSINSKVKVQEDDDICPQRSEEAAVNCEKVSLMTLHAAKGLEFSVVFIVGCEEKLLPLDIHQMRANVEEERRLLYVGMTRAKTALFLSYANHRYLYGQKLTCAPSPFLKDIEEELKEVELNERKLKTKRKDLQSDLFKN